jgi:hypothetical protein
MIHGQQNLKYDKAMLSLFEILETDLNQWRLTGFIALFRCDRYVVIIYIKTKMINSTIKKHFGFTFTVVPRIFLS